MVNFISSRDNKTVKNTRSLLTKKGRDKQALYFAEGVRLVEDAIAHSKDCIEYFVVSKSYASENKEYIDALDKNNKSIYVIEDKIFKEICDTKSPQGIGAVLKKENREISDFSEFDYALILDGVSEPGNMGTIIRTAEASGIDVICLMNNCADIYSPKVVRAAMGSVFRMKFCDLESVKSLQKSGFTVAAATLYDSVSVNDTDISGKRAVVIGNEAHGVSKEVISQCDLSVRIDMRGKTESLNAAVAAGILMYLLRP